jgi:response regulator RpfG family c-di-GMP phosphodiesterase
LVLSRGIKIGHSIEMNDMGKRKNVLVVDDDLDFQMMISIILGNRGFKVKCLLNGLGNSVFQLARLSDIVLMDIELPGTNGIDLGRQLKSDPQTENIPIILISGCADGPGVLRSSRADAFIEKPFSLSGLCRKIDELLTS